MRLFASLIFQKYLEQPILAEFYSESKKQNTSQRTHGIALIKVTVASSRFLKGHRADSPQSDIPPFHVTKRKCAALILKELEQSRSHPKETEGAEQVRWVRVTKPIVLVHSTQHSRQGMSQPSPHQQAPALLPESLLLCFSWFRVIRNLSCGTSMLHYRC